MSNLIVVLCMTWISRCLIACVVVAAAKCDKLFLLGLPPAVGLFYLWASEIARWLHNHV